MLKPEISQEGRNQQFFNVVRQKNHIFTEQKQS